MNKDIQITITQPDDWHLHLRDGTLLQQVVQHTAAQFARAIIMPNLKPPMTTTEVVLAYRQRILDALPANNQFQPLMTLYLTETMSPDEIHRAQQSGHIYAAKLYPAGATTNSSDGVRDPANIYPVLEAMQKADMPLLIHGEVTDPEVDVFDREAVFIERHLLDIVKNFPALRIVLEHVTTREGAHFVRDASANIAATITPQHLLLNRNALFQGGIKPHNYCLPILKRETHRQALLDIVTSRHPRFFAGTDSAPHSRINKESACGCAGIYSAHAAIELYAEAFENINALDKLEGFLSFYGADFYRLPRNSGEITLYKEDWEAPASYPVDGEEIIPFRAGEKIRWKL
ncbi:MAG: dihydroorotase [Gammaproteobacteria bacterium]|nr:dihydroorotase [Gammaproteobacteria bacterium]